MPTAKSSAFAAAIDATPHLQGQLKAGLQALPARDHANLATSNPRRLVGSVFVDDALKTVYPQANRWDYAIATVDDKGKETVHWVEVHGAQNETDAKELIRKRKWLETWWSGDGRQIAALKPRVIVYLSSSGSVGLSKLTPVYRQLAELGMLPKGRYSLC
jgi:hypothetical protein